MKLGTNEDLFDFLNREQSPTKFSSEKTKLRNEQKRVRFDQNLENCTKLSN